MNNANDIAFDPKEIRRQLGLNQQAFWTKIGVTQSGGSRYENGRRMPKPVQELLRVVHIERIDLSTIHRVDIDMIEYLRDHEPQIYERLCNKKRRSVPEKAARKRNGVDLTPEPANVYRNNHVRRHYVSDHRGDSEKT